MRMEVQRLEIPDEDHGARVDEVLARVLGTSVRKVKLWCERGWVKRGGVVLRKGDRVRSGDDIEILVPDRSNEPLPEVGFTCVTPALLAVDKPGGLPSHRLRVDDPPSALEAVVARFPEVRTSGPDPREGGLLHRLDVGTSGLLAFARHPEAYEAGRDAFKNGRAGKLYYALVHGSLPDRGEITLPIAHHPSDARLSVVVAHAKTPHREQPRAARTSFHTLARRGDEALILVDAQGGRRHQIRVHLLHLGAPLMGDELYGGPAWSLPGHALHACWLSIPMPTSGDGLVAHSPAPEGWRTVVEERLGREGRDALEQAEGDPWAAWTA